jgi:transcriptional regulator with XRE-family HTH domain
MGYGGLIRERRKGKGLSQTELAKAVSVSRSAIYAWECENFPPTDAKNIAALESVLGIESSYLYKMIYSAPSPQPAAGEGDKKDSGSITTTKGVLTVTMNITATSGAENEVHAETEFHIKLERRVRREDRDEILAAFAAELDKQLAFDEGR